VAIPYPGGQPWDPRAYHPGAGGIQATEDAWYIMLILIRNVIPAAWDEVLVATGL